VRKPSLYCSCKQAEKNVVPRIPWIGMIDCLRLILRQRTEAGVEAGLRGAKQRQRRDVKNGYSEARESAPGQLVVDAVCHHSMKFPQSK